MQTRFGRYVSGRSDAGKVAAKPGVGAFCPCAPVHVRISGTLPSVLGSGFSDSHRDVKQLQLNGGELSPLSGTPSRASLMAALQHGLSRSSASVKPRAFQCLKALAHYNNE